MEKNTKQSFRMSIIAIALLMLSIAILILSKKYTLPAYVIGIPFFLTFLSGAIGWIYSLKSFKEDNTIRKILSIIINSFFVLCLIAFILGDLLK
jgi:peptidoglycan/LPS O-acetylase OafA/YrhL